MKLTKYEMLAIAYAIPAITSLLIASVTFGAFTYWTIICPIWMGGTISVLTLTYGRWAEQNDLSLRPPP